MKSIREETLRKQMEPSIDKGAPFIINPYMPYTIFDAIYKEILKRDIERPLEY